MHHTVEELRVLFLGTCAKMDAVGTAKILLPADPLLQTNI